MIDSNQYDNAFLIQRQQYLEAMGVDCWLPLSQLPGAAESALWVKDFQYPAPEIPFQSELQAVTPNISSKPAPVSKESAISAKAGLSQVRGLLGDESEPVVTAKPQEQALNVRAEIGGSDTEGSDVAEVDAEITADSISVTETPNFKLAFIRVGQVLLIDSLPTHGKGVEGGHRQLAQALAKVCSAELTEGMEEPFILPWPMFASKTLDQSRGQAIIAVQHKLNKVLKSADISAVLLLGESAAQMVMDRSEPLEQLRGVLFTLSTGCKAISGYSLTELMHLPGAKREFWQDLQPLLKQLPRNV